MQGNICDVSDSNLACTPVSASTSQIVVDVSYSLTGIYTVTSFSLGLYAKASGSFGAAADYTLLIQLPQQVSGTVSVFGNTIGAATSYSTCTSSFTVGTTANDKNMNFNSLIT